MKNITVDFQFLRSVVVLGIAGLLLGCCLLFNNCCQNRPVEKPLKLEELFHDDFNGDKLDDKKWKLAGGQVDVRDGVLSLCFDTFNPGKPGTFLDTRIETLAAFARGNKGIQFEAKLRVGEMPDGLVPAFYAWMMRKVDGKDIRDEIDIEFLSRQFNHSLNGNPEICLTSHGFTRFPLVGATQLESTDSRTVKDLDLHQFNVYAIRWLPDRTEWYVNGQLIRTYSGIFAKANEPMYVHLSIWKPQSTWPDAYDGALTPDNSPDRNRRFSLDVDYVRVYAINP